MIIESSYPMHYQPPIAYSISPGDDLVSFANPNLEE